jgi:hypothetical protein
MGILPTRKSWVGIRTLTIHDHPWPSNNHVGINTKLIDFVILEDTKVDYGWLL